MNKFAAKLRDALISYKGRLRARKVLETEIKWTENCPSEVEIKREIEMLFRWEIDENERRELVHGLAKHRSWIRLRGDVHHIISAAR